MLSDKVTSFLGRSDVPMILEVDSGSIKKLADAVGDRNALYWDHEYAWNAGYSSIIAPPGFFGWPVKWEGQMPFFSKIKADLIEALTEEGYSRHLDGGIGYEFLQPVYAGDTIITVASISDLSLKESKTGEIVFSIIENTYTNQHGALVAIARQTMIAR